MFKRKVLSAVGWVLIAGSMILTLYVGMLSLIGERINLEDIKVLGVIIGCPMLVGTTIIAFSVQRENRRKSIRLAEIGFLFIYGIILFTLVFGGTRLRWSGFHNQQSLAEYIRFNSNFIPFKTIIYYIGCFFSERINRHITVENLAGNFMLFMPMGFLLPAIFKSQQKWLRFMMTLAFLLISIELIQLIFRLGTFDIDDFILNMTGACLIYAIIRGRRIKEFLNEIKLI